MVQIKQMLVSSRAVTSGEGNPCNYIVVHETANTSKGANALMHATLQRNGFTASWHYTVDDKNIYQSYPDTVKCWHAGDGGNGKGNGQGIGIEICVNSDGDFKKAVENAAELVKNLMKKHNIPQKNVIQHNVTSSWGKNCPANLRSGKIVSWADFNRMIDGSGGTVSAPETETKPSTTNKPSSKPKSSGSVVDYMNSKGMDSSYSNRAKLAKQYGISNYKGTASQNSTLLSKIKEGKPKQSTPSKKGDLKTTSIVTYLNSIGVNSSYSNRAKLAAKHGIKGYKGSASQNTKLLKILRGGSTPKKSGKTVAQMAKEVIDGKHGNGHANRRKSLGISQAQYNKVRAEVNKRM